jgi:filamentous hemagglutinin family protein
MNRLIPSLQSFFKTAVVYHVMSCSSLIALPQLKEIVSGNVQAKRHQENLQITVSDKAIINYESFNIGKDSKVTFIQPKSNSTVLNRVQGGDPSAIMGQLNANGRVFLINPNGIIIGPSGSINTASFIASTLDIANDDFLNDRFQFNLKPGSENSSILNQGHISCPEGAIALLAPHIRNEGAIMAQAGKVVLTGGEKVTLDFSGDGLMSFSVDGDVKAAVI